MVRFTAQTGMETQEQVHRKHVRVGYEEWLQYSPQSHRQLQALGGGAFFLLMTLGAVLCCICCCARETQQRARRRRMMEEQRQQHRANQTSAGGGGGMATVAGQTIGLNITDIESIRQFITAESSRQVLEELAAALQESRKEYIANHLIRNTVTNNNLDSIRSLAVETAVPRPQDAYFTDNSTDVGVVATIGEQDDEETQFEEDTHLTTDATLGGITATAQGSTTDESTCCTICLEDYKVGDVVCRSKNGAIAGCFHKFHQDCITDWLMNHDDCPCCRTSFFQQEVTEESKENVSDAVTPNPTS